MVRGKRVWGSTIVLGIILILVAFGSQIDAQQEAGESPKLLTSHDELFYVNSLLVDFVRPGLTAKLENPSIGGDRRLSVEILITDDKGLPLDRDGIFTPGDISLSFIAAHLPSVDSTYVAYTTRTAVSSLTGNSAIQASTDSGGTYTKLEDGLYRYTFGTILPQGYPASETHAIGVYATRDLSDFELGSQYSNDVLEFVPTGGPVTDTRDIVSTETCNMCHDELALHGGRRREVRLCVLCHTEQSSDPDTGNTVDFKVMIHKIHQGEGLPSVEAGTPYQIIGFRGSVHDYSGVVFPSDVRRCEQCHQGASQSMNYLTRPSAAACGACHDDVVFATGENHAGIAQADDTRCVLCHIPVGDVEFDLSIAGAHTIPTESAQLPGTVFEILGVDNGVPGSSPTVNFSITDDAGAPIAIADMSRLALVMAGPTSDYAAYVSESALGAAGANGIYSYTFDETIDAGFTGSMAVGVEGYRSVSLEDRHGDAISVRDAGLNNVFYFDTGGGTATPRRTVVELETCNACHGSLALHGDNRNNIEQCVLCHTPLQTDVGRRPAELLPAESVHFKTMIHKIHTGEELDEDLTIYGFGNRPHNYNEVVFPGDRRNCLACHVEGSQQLPLPTGMLASASPRGLIDPLPPESAACLGCHTSLPALVHATLQTSILGESCAVCHGPNREFSVDRVHAQ